MTYITLFYLPVLVAAADPTFQPFNAIAHFQPEGQIATSLTMINVKVNLPINDIITEVEELIQVAANETIRQSTFWVQNRTIMEINVIANDLRQSLRELKKISGISQGQRPKRQAIVGLGLLGGWALKNIVDGIFGHGGDHHYDIDMLKNVKGLSSKVQLMQTSLKHLANVEKEMLAKHHRTNYRLRQIENAENAISILESTRNRVTQWVSGVENAFAGKLTTNLFSIHHADAVLREVGGKIATHFINPVEETGIATIYQLPVQLETVENGLLLTIKMPLYNTAHVFMLYKYTEIITSLKNGLRISYFSDKKTHLATDNFKGSFLELNANDLAESLFHLDKINIKKYCTTHMHTTRALQITQLNTNTLIIVTLNNAVAHSQCFKENGTVNKQIHHIEPGTWQMALSTDCDLQVEDYFISKGPEQLTVPTDTIGIIPSSPIVKLIQEWNDDVVERLDGRTLDEINEAIEDINHGQDIPTSIIELESYLANKSISWHNTVLFITVTAIILLYAGLTYIAFKTRKRLRRRIIPEEIARLSSATTQRESLQERARLHEEEDSL
ncbi:Polyprotein of retroviral origin [Caligus rogercresseyi]|uniref:Polyprotein of retroviral origin n=1 Tax=Caligus rogercresseyi TaxID=217165 RepID=A0A7T8KEP1_CALRO|nr:Polyprotein of retroviral origin [Caligus rogercresseyi]